MGTFIYDRVGFNDEVVKAMCEDEFVNHQMHENHYTRLDAETKRTVLHRIYHLITGIGPDELTGRRDE